MANFLSEEKRLRVLAALVEGNSERAIERMTGVQQKTIGRFALSLGEGAVNLHNRLARGLHCPLVTVDEIWSYVAKKQARVTPEDGPDVGEAYTFVALDASSRFVIGWHVGKRDQASTDIFMQDIRARLVVMPAMTSDGFAPYISAIGASFGLGVDYAQTVKNYSKRGRRDDDHRYEPPRLDGGGFITKRAIFGAPNLDRASTAYVERNNATMRHHIGRMRRLCLAFSKRLDRHRAAVALNYAWYNLGTVVKTLRVTPAMQLGLTDHVWTLEEFQAALLTAGLCEPPERQPLAPRVPEGPARELPNGRGFLRVVGGGKASAERHHVEPPPVTPAPVVVPVEPVADPTGQLDLFAWRPKAPPIGQLPLFPGFDDPKGGE
ncbi:transposase [Polyangium mundeleinium]|uniref:Transposase n=1 Tax=Polyangium mundeleinium TaxID=2995306 RepID=A0ABT5EZX2_9BACT|nr:transposase [Polyangium mundeleinium]MDC0747360.1 transposase [Polyangium mundeleinium]